jgi:hypothetical protein
MSQGQIDHPSYVARQQLCLGNTTVGASKTDQKFTAPISNVRIRACSALVNIAGTAAATVALFAIGTGTTFTATSSATFTTTSTIGTATLSTSAAGTVVAISTDANLTINSGGRLVSITGTDATVQSALFVEAYVDPLSSWTGN